MVLKAFNAVIVIQIMLLMAVVTLPCSAQDKGDDFHQGQAYFKHGQYQKAIDCFNLVLATDPSNVRALNNRGMSFRHLKQSERAIADFDKAITLDPKYAIAFNNRGLAKLSLKQYRQAISDLNQAIAINPKYDKAFDDRGSAYSHLKQYKKAISDFNQAVSLNPSYAKTFNGRGVTYHKMKEYGRAIADFNQALSLDPSYTTALDNRGIDYNNLMHYDLAIADFDKAVALDPADATALANRSWSYAKLKKSAESARDLARARSIDANNISVQKIKRLLSQLVIDTPIQDKWALIIGISKFANPQYNLRYAAKDAKDFYDYLITDGHFQKDHVLLMVDGQATKTNILNAFGDKWLPHVCRKGDLAVVYVSTHGTPVDVDRGGHNYIVAYDTDADSLFATGVNMDDLYLQIKERVLSDRALIIMDTCYSGGGVPGSKGIARSGSFDAEDLAEGCGHLVITSSSLNERSWESKNKANGIFTIHLLDALRAKGGNIDIKSAFETARREVKSDVSTNYKQSQTPQLGGEWEGPALVLSAPAAAPRPVPADAQSFAAKSDAPSSSN